MSIPEKASMANKPGALTDAEKRSMQVERVIIALETIAKNLNYTNTNVYELQKKLDNIERGIDAASRHIVGFRE